MVAQELAMTHPGRVERLALLCTSPGGAGGSSFPLHTLARLPADERVQRYTGLIDTRFTPDWLAAHGNHRALVAALTATTASDQTDGEALQLRARAAHDVYDRLPAITCPTPVASGRHDGIAPPGKATAIADRLPHAELHLFYGGHLFLLQDRTALPAVIRFLADC
jgi:3-oxoadipate enol-lactonase